MRLTGKDIRAGREPYDVCVIGSGPSGMTAALEAKSRGLTVCVLESGGAVRGAAPEDLKAVDSAGLSIRPESRERVFGGTSTTWSGFIAPFDPIDFAPRPGLHDGWPIGLDTLQAEIDRAGYRYGLPSAEAFRRDVSGPPENRLPALPALDAKVFRTQVPPFNFGKTFAYAFLPEGFDVYLGATVTRFERDGGLVKAAIAMDEDGHPHRVEARFFVLAASAIESVRILFNSDGFGNAHDQLGRYFMNHPKGDVATVVLSRPIEPDHEILQSGYGGLDGYVGLRLDEEEQRRTGLLNTYVRFEPLRGGGDYPRAKELSRAFKAVMKATGRGDVKALPATLAHLFGRAGGLPQLILRGYHRATRPKQTVLDAVKIRCFVEMEPLADQRIEPGEGKDRHGMPIPRVTHAMSGLARASVDHLLETVAAKFAAAGFGTVTRAAQPLDHLLAVDASHHMGGARMGHDPASSVVDASLKLHEADNLYLSGGAVFPTGGSANPTLSMIGLSIRLADTIAARLGRAGPSVAPKTGQGIIVVGAGRRVGEDIVPAIEALAPAAHVQAIFATGRKAVFGPTAVHDVCPLESLTAADVAAAAIVYVAVPTKRVAAVVKQLTRHDCRHLTLIVDTPAVDAAAVGGAYDGFARVVVAEDAAFLPWIDLIHRAGAVKTVRIDRSAYRYHAVATARALAGRSRPGLASSHGRKNEIDLVFAAGEGRVEAKVLGPRDYDRGTLEIGMADGSRLASHAGKGCRQIVPVISGHFCTGFRLDEHAVDLSPTESALLGRFTPQDTIVSRMLDIKRVGLYRLLSQVLAGETAYSLGEALEDNSPKW